MSKPFNGRYQLAVVIVTVGRESLLRAVRSVFSQQFSGNIQILIGVDLDLSGQLPHYRQILDQERPANVDIVWLDLGYSTSKRHGGVHDCYYGGSLRSALTLLADSELVTYLDDDDWFLPQHIDKMYSVFCQYPDVNWGHALCYYADGNTGEILCLDELESVGVDQGIFKDSFGGFVRPSGLTLNKLKTLPYLHCWSQSLAQGDGEDRILFDHLKQLRHFSLAEGTVCCALDPKDSGHEIRLAFIKQKTGRDVVMQDKRGSTR
ncbi:glycosyltransferase family A protein [Actinobacillus suis]|uniref:Glycosyltransferase n=2 Tax=Actinobacillus suis TaxID=716 RepID=K0G3I3_ACTSU|nr:glycosyltransferase family A protein [Actinobacillus suis]AFU18214.1 glycosyltransferase [Actinobacillus suis H91-0380]AIJ30347.1 glycosyltransferase [Actinobacillus suis ATCC 33415]MCO4167489.1 glycosyltransferase family 2 protein [Actinobacillus suis]MCO4169978.1 glycosyltransferase family 2 protein [Actinobacillus suis]MCQ9630704.1 glycosyltransferase family 2 protein [Actinobacillus suis]